MSERTRDFAAEVITDEMPAGTRYLILTPRPSDWLQPDGTSFPVSFRQDRLPFPQRYVGPLEVNGVIEFLWREGSVPQWIDVGVYAIDAECTYLEIMFGQFVSDDRLLYYGPSFGAGELIHDIPPFMAALGTSTHLPLLVWKPDVPGEFDLHPRHK